MFIAKGKWGGAIKFQKQIIQIKDSKVKID